MTYLLIALFIFSVLQIKNSIIFVFFAVAFLVILIKKKTSYKKLLVIPIVLVFFMVNNISLSPQKSFVAVVVESKENYYLINSMYSRYYVYQKDNDKEEGDLLKVQGSRVYLESNAVEEQFDFVEFLNNKGYYYQLYVKEEKVIVSSLLNKKLFLKKLENNLSSDSFSLLKGLFFGINDEQSIWFLLSEILHFYPLASGSGYYFSKLNKAFKKNTKKPKKWLFYLLILPFILIRPTRFLFLRLGVYELINIVVKKRKNKISLLSKVGISALIIIAINPYYVYQSSFILSYAILLMYALITPFFKGKKPLVKKVVPFILLQLIIWLYEWYTTYEINLFTPILSLLLPIFYLFFIVLGGMMFLGFYQGIEKVSSFYKSFTLLFSNFSINLNLGGISLYSVLVIIVFMVIIIIQFAKNNYKYLKRTGFIVVCLLLHSAFPFQKAEQSITFINVGQGDAILIRSAGKTLLIDTGGTSKFDIATECLIPYFKKNQITKIDYFLATHQDFDHTGGLTTLKTYNYIDSIIENLSSPLKLGNIYIENLNVWQREMTDENNKSYVMSLSINEKKILLMGDAEIEVEKKMLAYYDDLKHDIIKVGHHGSSSSSSKEFLKAVNPKTAIISVGKNNSYDHPSKEVIERLTSLGIEIRRTDIEGSIKYY